MALPWIAAWTDQHIVLFHGTTDAWARNILNAVDETRGRYFTDFGRGFYTTTRLNKAEAWANAKAQRTGGTAAVIAFTVSRNDLALLDCLFFIGGDRQALDYWSFVKYCRTIGGDHNRAQTPWYDLVAGPVTGKWKQQTFLPDADQISFHTPAGAALLDNSRKVQII